MAKAEWSASYSLVTVSCGSAAPFNNSSYPEAGCEKSTVVAERVASNNLDAPSAV